MYEQQSRRRRVPPWGVGLAALATVALVVGAAGWFALRGVHDGGTSGHAEAVSSASPPVGESTSAPSPTPSTLHERVEQRENHAAELAAGAGDAGRVGDDDAADPAVSSAELTGADLAAARGWLTTALAWREDEAALGPWGRAVERANTEWAHPDVQVTVVPSTALEAIASDATVHGALPRVVEIVDEADPEWAAPGEATLRAEVVFGAGSGWTRPGLRLLVGLEVAGGEVMAVFIDDGYVVSDPELLP